MMQVRSDMAGNEHTKQFEPTEPVLKCGCGSVPQIRSYMNGVLRFKMYCPECEIETALSDSCEIALDRWNVAMAGHESVNEWCSLYDDRGDNCATELDKVESIIKKREEESVKNGSVVERIVAYINSKMKNTYIVEFGGYKDISSYVEKYCVEAIIEAVDISAERYLEFEEGVVTEASAELFLTKIGGILYNKHASPVEQECIHVRSYIKNIFSYCNTAIAKSLLNQYVDALRGVNYTDDNIVKDLKGQFAEMTKDCTSWSMWKNTVQNWIKQVKEEG